MTKASLKNSPYTPGRNTILLDWDGVVSPYDKNFVVTYFKKAIMKVAEKLAQKEGITDPEEAHERARKIIWEGVPSMIRHGDALHHYVKKYGLDENEMKREMGYFMQDNPEFPSHPPEGLKEELQRTLASGVKIIIISHSDTAVIEESMRRMGLSDVFKDTPILGLDKLENTRKDQEGAFAYRKALRLMGVEANQAVTADDSKDNLQRVKAELPEIQTVFIAKNALFHKTKIQAQRVIPSISYRPEDADRNHPSLLDFLKAFNNERGQEAGPASYIRNDGSKGAAYGR